MKVLNSLHHFRKNVSYFGTRGPLFGGEKFIEGKEIWNYVLGVLLGKIAIVNLQLGRFFWIFLAKNDSDVLLNALTSSLATLFFSLWYSIISI